MADDLFCQIVAGEKPAFAIAEDERHLAFLDIHPKKTGHTLVIPKEHSDYLWEMEPGDYELLMRFARKVAHQLQSSFKAERVMMEVIGVDVPHTHIHLIPSGFSVSIKKDRFKEVQKTLIGYNQ